MTRRLADKLTPRTIAALTFAVSLAAIGGAWIYESLGYLPCELCYKERVPYYAAFALAPLAGFAAQTGRAGLARGAFALMALLFAGDAALSIYHSGVEWKIFAGPSDCSGAVSTAGSMDDFMKQLKTVKVVRCDEPTLWVLGLTLANWNVVITAALAWVAALGARQQPAMSEAEDYAQRIRRALSSMEAGSLRFWGESFGRPGDSYHRLIGAEAEGDALRLTFDFVETVTIWSPKGLEIGAGGLRIADAERVRLDWYSYGAERIPENSLFMDFRRGEERVFMTSSGPVFSRVIADIDLPAVELA